MTQSRYNRVLLKMSGEALQGDRGFGFDPRILSQLANDIADVSRMGVELAVVVGGGNIMRGTTATELGIDRAQGDHMGMLATVMNAIAVQSALEERNVDTRVLSAIPMDNVCEPYIRRRAIRHLEKGRVVICAGGTGNPYFTTDSAAALRAAELRCDALLKGTQVDGVYSADPKKDPDARHLGELTYQHVLENQLKVMDASAISLARENAIPILVFSLHSVGSFGRMLTTGEKHTIIHGEA